MRRYIWIAGLVTLWLAWGCMQETGKPQGETPVSTTVERSELALLMREMHDHLKLVGDSLKQGLEVHPHRYAHYRGITSARATAPSKVDGTYEAMAQAFLRSYERFEQGDSNRLEVFNGMIDHCLACHRQKCTGPVKIIRKLKLKDRASPG